MKYLSICTIMFGVLMVFSFSFFLYGVVVFFNQLTYFLEWEIIMLSSSSIIMTFLFDWMVLIFMSFVLLISSLVTYYSK